MIDRRRLRDVASAATQGSWQVIETELPCRLGRPHIERRIFTAMDHPQLKAPFPVVNGSVALGTDEAPVHHMVSMTAEDAAFIAAFDPPNVLALLDQVDALEGPHDDLAEDLIKQLVDHAQTLPALPDGEMGEFTIVCLASAGRIRRQEVKVGQLQAEIGTLTGAAESIRDEWRKDQAQIVALRKALAECADSLHAEMLQKFGGQLPTDMHPVTRRDYDRDMAELAGYRMVSGGVEPTLDTPDLLAHLHQDNGDGGAQ
ncbi:ead/Ea22-like family protein (plasmid) [Pseudomonas yamanorum]|nr:ead/Ea22-like family protein [Pseudomonas yamanorum]